MTFSKADHDKWEHHRVGETFPLPVEPSNSFPGDTPQIGNSDTGFALADHIHGREAAGAADPSPLGMIVMWSAEVPPTGWLICDGSAISRTTYADLFARISTTFGAGDGVSTFNIPNFEARFPIGDNDGTYNLGGVGGASSDTVTTTDNDNSVEVQSGAGTTVADDPHTHDATVDTIPPYLVVHFIIKATN